VSTAPAQSTGQPFGFRVQAGNGARPAAGSKIDLYRLAASRDEIIALLEKLWCEHELTLVLVTHDSSVAGRAQRVGLMKNGRLTIRHGTRTTEPVD